MAAVAIRIFCRIRPRNPNGNTIDYQSILDDSGKQKGPILQIENPEFTGFSTHQYEFNEIFQEDSTQQEVYNEVAKPVIDWALEGYNGTIFAYGQTATGKTYTILGDVKEDFVGNVDQSSQRFDHFGIIPRTAIEIFNRIGDNVEVEMSYMEIYNEVAYDLLTRKSEKKIKAMSDLTRVEPRFRQENGAFFMKGLSMHPITNANEAMAILMKGNRNRSVAETQFNKASSRSHCILTLKFTRREGERIFHSKINLVDLAGSERVGRSNENNKERINEANNINVSLLQLELVMRALSENNGHIPYRNSTLTKCLQSNLGGNSFNTMIATISSDQGNLGETFATCRFSQQVAAIQNIVVINESTDLNLKIERLENELKGLRGQQSTEDTIGKDLTDDDLLRMIEKYLKNIIKTLDIGNNQKRREFCFERLKTIILNEREKALAESKEKERLKAELEELKRNYENQPNGEKTKLTEQTITELNIKVQEYIKNSIEINVGMDVSKVQYCFQILRDALLAEKVERVKDEPNKVAELRIEIEALKKKLENAKSTEFNLSLTEEEMYNLKANIEHLFQVNSEDNLNKDVNDSALNLCLGAIKDKILDGRKKANVEVDEIASLKAEIESLKHELKKSKEKELANGGLAIGDQANGGQANGGQLSTAQLTAKQQKNLMIMINNFVQGNISQLGVGLNQAQILFCFQQLKVMIVNKKVIKSTCCVIM